jgi:DNA-binding NarL/FixJ family response regulator
MANQSTVYLLEDHVSIRQLLRTHVELDSNYRVVGETGRGATAIHDCVLLRPDVIILDLLLPDMLGTDVITEDYKTG